MLQLIFYAQYEKKKKEKDTDFEKINDQLFLKISAF